MAKCYGVHMGYIVGRVIETEYDELWDYVEIVEDALRGQV